jgi:hypothetical protein
MDGEVMHFMRKKYSALKKYASAALTIANESYGKFVKTSNTL